MYFPQNWKFGSALSKLLNFVRGLTPLPSMDWKGEVRDQCSLVFGLIIISIWSEKPKIIFYAWVPED
jgi:hypothetical protein